MTESMQIEVVFATPSRQELIALELRHGATVEEAICDSNIQSHFDEALDEYQAGVWGRPVGRDHNVKDGDRIEIYRPLARDPMDARRELARIQRLGSSS